MGIAVQDGNRLSPGEHLVRQSRYEFGETGGTLVQTRSLQRRRPAGGEPVLEARVRLHEDRYRRAAVPLRRREDFLQPREIRGVALAVFRVLLGRAAEVVVGADDVDRREQPGSDAPARVLPELGVARIVALALELEPAPAQALIVDEEQLAQPGQPLDGFKAAGPGGVAVGPLVVAGRIDERMARR